MHQRRITSSAGQALAAPEGVWNKFTQELKQTILDAMHNANDEDLFGFGRDTACDTPTAGLALSCSSSPSRCLARSTTPSRSPYAEDAVENRSAQIAGAAGRIGERDR